MLFKVLRNAIFLLLFVLGIGYFLPLPKISFQETRPQASGPTFQQASDALPVQQGQKENR